MLSEITNKKYCSDCIHLKIIYSTEMNYYLCISPKNSDKITTSNYLKKEFEKTSKYDCMFYINFEKHCKWFKTKREE